MAIIIIIINYIYWPSTVTTALCAHTHLHTHTLTTHAVSLWNCSGSVARKRKDLTEFDVCLTIYNNILKEAM